MWSEPSTANSVRALAKIVPAWLSPQPGLKGSSVSSSVLQQSGLNISLIFALLLPVKGVATRAVRTVENWR